MISGASASSTSGNPTLDVLAPAVSRAEGEPAAVDFTAVLLLLLGFGSTPPESEAGHDDRPAPQEDTARASDPLAVAIAASMAAPLAIIVPKPASPVPERSLAPAVTAPPPTVTRLQTADAQPDTGTASVGAAAVDAAPSVALPASSVMPASVDRGAPARDAEQAKVMPPAADATPVAPGALAMAEVVPPGLEARRSDEPPRVGVIGAQVVDVATAAAAPRPDVAGEHDQAPRDERRAGRGTPAVAAEPARVDATSTAALQAAAVSTTPGAPAAAVDAAAPVTLDATVASAEPVPAQVVRAVRLAIDEGRASMRVELDPPGLGAVRVEADQHGDTIAIRLTAERDDTRQLLVSALPDIQQALATRGAAATSVAITPSFDAMEGRRAPERKTAERERRHERPTDERRAARPRAGVATVDLTV